MDDHFEGTAAPPDQGTEEYTPEPLSPETQVAATERARRVPAVAEALGYVGGALALAAVIALVATFWAELGLWGRIGVAGGLGIGALLGGFLLARVDDEAAERLSSFLFAVGVAGVAVAVGFLVNDMAKAWPVPAVLDKNPVEHAGEWGWFAGWLVAAVIGGVVWSWRKWWGEHFVFGVSVAMAVLFALPLIPVKGPDWGAGVTLSLVGVVWGVLAYFDLIPPSGAAYTLAALGINGGMMLAALPHEKPILWLVWLGVALAALLVWAGSHLRRIQVLAISAASVAVFAYTLLDHYIGSGMGMPITLLGIGFALLGAGVYLILRGGADISTGRAIGAEVASGVGVALALAGGGMLVGEFSEQLGDIGRVAVPTIGAVVGYGTAHLLRNVGSRSSERLVQVLLAIAVAAVGFAVALAAQPYLKHRFGAASSWNYDYASSWQVFAGALAALIASAATWWMRKGSMTLLAFAVAILVALTSGFSLGPDMMTTWLPSTPILAIAAALLWLGLIGKMEPEQTAVVLGCLGLIFGVQMFNNGFHEGPPPSWPALTGVAIGIAEIAGSIVLKRMTLLGFGAAGVVMFTFTYVMERFGGSVQAPLLLAIMGAVFIAVAVLVTVLMPRLRGKRDAPATT